jgi:hypothetical protein
MGKASLEERVKRYTIYYLSMLDIEPEELTFAFGTRETMDCYAATEAEWPYHQVTFHFDLTDIERRMGDHPTPEEWLKKLVRHEVIHFAIAPLATTTDRLATALGKPVEDIVTDIEEFLVRRLTNAPLWDHL